LIVARSEDIYLIKKKLLSMLEKSLDNVEFPIMEKASEVLENIQRGKYVLFISEDLQFIIVAGITVSNSQTILNLMKMAGEDFAGHYEDADKTITDFAKSIGATKIYCHARLGITKKLEDCGYEELVFSKKHKHMIKAIGDSANY
jgi:hypothetical protein